MRTASEAVAEQIRARIATGALKPGDTLPSETDLLDEFGVARPTMREALRILESDGLVTVRRGVNGGARVTEPDIETLARRAGLHLQIRHVHMGDLMEALRVIQPGAVALAATAASPDQVRELRARIDQVAVTDAIGDFTDQAMAFLNVLVQVSGNETLAFLSSLLERLFQVEARALVDQYVPDHGPDVDPEFRSWCVDQYSHLVDMIEAGHADDAARFWGEHISAMPPLVDDATALTVYRTRRRTRRTR